MAPRNPPRATAATATAAAAIGLALALASCGAGDSGSGGGSASTVPGGAKATDVEVIQGWAAALDRGDLGAAASYFALPSTAENGPLLLRITTRGEARAFNATLPCGARVIRASSAGNFTTATFRLGERPGPGSCGPGSGSLARTTFVIRDGKIVQWRRVGAGGGSKPLSPTV